MGHGEIVVGIGAGDLRDVGKAIVDERNAGQLAAREHAVDLGVVGRFDELVGEGRGRAEREGAQGGAQRLQTGVDTACHT